MKKIKIPRLDRHDSIQIQLEYFSHLWLNEFNQAERDEYDEHPYYCSNVWGECRTLIEGLLSGICCYCDQKVASVGSREVEHYLPKSKYPHLRFSWGNYLYACKFCNTAKGISDPKAEKWLDPRKHEPLTHIKLLMVGTLEGITSEGRKIIEGTNLNCDRPNSTRGITLVEDRERIFEKVDSDLKYLLSWSASSQIRVLNRMIDEYSQCKDSLSGVRLMALETVIDAKYPHNKTLRFFFVVVYFSYYSNL